jgi:hypothetical protein
MMSGMGGLDLSVKPKDAEVWVDGKYFAEARDLDGDPSYLWLKEGAHHVVLYKAGYRAFDEDVAVNVGIIRELKVRLEPGKSEPPVPAAPEARPESPRPEVAPPRAEATEPPAEVAPPRAEVTPPQGEPRGTVHLRVRPEDATVYVDGEYRGTARALEYCPLPPGHHRVELVRPGYQPLGTEFDVAAGQTTEVALSMEKQGGWKY